MRTGHILIKRSAEIDEALALGLANFLDFFEFVEVSDEVWNELYLFGFWFRLNQITSSMIDRYEEEWVYPERIAGIVSYLNDLLDSDNAASFSPNVRHFLEEFLIIATKAIDYNCPIIFAL